MKRRLKYIVAIVLCLTILSSDVGAITTFRTVRYNDTKDITETGTNWKKIRVFYDHGSPSIGDNARMFGTSVNNTRNYVGLRYANYGTTVFNETRKTTKGANQAYVNYNPLGMDYLQPGSFVQSEGVVSTGFWMQLKVTK
ncbi:hypothetical protein [Helcococcus kunzii]|uniref:hypothetical protein n=1 Tax=Helcococcus kunzii TaxID=40091 RepID=UPI0024ACE4E1|nr:hypothetical protein [Helcococcus kunzii]